jgi:hypothetical protein
MAACLCGLQRSPLHIAALFIVCLIDTPASQLCTDQHPSLTIPVCFASLLLCLQHMYPHHCRQCLDSAFCEHNTCCLLACLLELCRTQELLTCSVGHRGEVVALHLKSSTGELPASGTDLTGLLCQHLGQPQK